MLKQTHVANIPGLFRLESGANLADVSISVTTYGKLNSTRSNAVFVAHALTGSGDAADWWSGLIGPGRLFDPELYFIVCPNFLGSCYGSTGPESINPMDDTPYGNRFPVITIRDIAKANLLCMKALGIPKIEIAIGGSMGAMVLLEQALQQPDFSNELILIAAGATQTAWRIAFSSVVRKVIAGYGSDSDSLKKGLALARQLATTSYRCGEEFDVRFGRERAVDDPARFYDSSNLFEVERYLEHHGTKIVNRFSPNSYIALTRAMELHDLGRGRGTSALEAVSTIRSRALVIGIDTDILYPEAELQALAEAIPDAIYETLHAGCGHDSFLACPDRLEPIVRKFLRKESRPAIQVQRARRVAA